MKKVFHITLLAIAMSVTMTSCFSYSVMVGKGAQGNASVTKINHYVIEGLVPVEVSDPKQMAGSAENYTVNIQQTFLNCLLTLITGGLYSPTTTTVTK